MSTAPTSGMSSLGASTLSSIKSSSESASLNTAIVPTNIPISTTAASGQLPITSATSSLSQSTSQATPTTSSLSQSTSQATSTPSSSSDQKAKDSGSAAITPSSTPKPSPGTPPNNRLSNGAVAGIVVGVALGLALLTFLVTFVIMRRQKHTKSKRRYASSGNSGGFEMSTPRHRSSTTTTTTKTAQKPVLTEAYGSSATYEDYLPQSADDKTIQHRTESTLDQIELHIENFYRNSSSSAVRPDNAELTVFDSPYLPAPLASLLPRSQNRLNIMKHALAQSITSSISVSASPSRSLLPTGYTLLRNTVAPAKPGYTQILSRWRVMTAYLRPDPTKDAAYIAQRDRQISDTVQSFAKAFAPWKSTGYKDEERARSLSAILEDAASLGLFLFSQPSTMTFHWPASGEVRSGKIVVSPALLKTTDEKGRDLAEVQIMIDQIVLDA